MPKQPMPLPTGVYARPIDGLFGQRVRALQTWRGPPPYVDAYAGFNLGAHVGDDPARVNAARLALMTYVESLSSVAVNLRWLEQVHGVGVHRLTAASSPDVLVGDAVWSDQPGQVCVIMTADCLPILLATTDGSAVAAIHAGWRGLAQGVVKQCLDNIDAHIGQKSWQAWLGPAISSAAFSVGDEVRQAFVEHDGELLHAFESNPRYDGLATSREGPWLADLYELARCLLARCGVTVVGGGDECTLTRADHWYSYRREKTSGRMASLIWLAE